MKKEIEIVIKNKAQYDKIKQILAFGSIEFAPESKWHKFNKKLSCDTKPWFTKIKLSEDDRLTIEHALCAFNGLLCCRNYSGKGFYVWYHGENWTDSVETDEEYLDLICRNI